MSGQPAVLWPAGVPVYRWAVCLTRLRHGNVRGADLLTWQGRPLFSFLDDAGRRRFRRAERAELMTRIGELQVQGRMRAPLPPRPGDSSSEHARIEALDSCRRRYAA